MDGALVDFAPAARLAALVLLIALMPLSWWWLRQRRADTRARLAALTAITLFLTFDLVVFGSFTRLSDSGLGCPDWPGCYGSASPLGASAAIDAAQSIGPDGPVTWNKAWIEMIHRYLAMTVGALILVLAVASRFERARLSRSPWWPWVTLAWVVAQGLFGMLTVTLKLHPVVVTLHLLGGLVLLGLLALQREALQRRPMALNSGMRWQALLALAFLTVQIALGGWVSTNHAVLACTGFPKCNDVWWPVMDFANAFTASRGGGAYLTIEGLVAIQMAHRVFALFASAALLWLAAALMHAGDAAKRRFGWGIGLLLLAQLASGLGNVVLGWPLAAALAHSAGAAVLVTVLTTLLARMTVQPRLLESSSPWPRHSLHR